MRRIFGSVLAVGLVLGLTSQAQAQISIFGGGPFRGVGAMLGSPYGYSNGYGGYSPYAAQSYGYSSGYGGYSPYAAVQPYYGYSGYNSYGSAYVAPGTTSFNSGTYGYMGPGAAYGQGYGYYGGYPPVYSTPVYSTPVYGYSSSYGYRATGGPFMGVPRPFAGLVPFPR